MQVDPISALRPTMRARDTFSFIRNSGYIYLIRVGSFRTFLTFCNFLLSNIEHCRYLLTGTFNVWWIASRLSDKVDQLYSAAVDLHTNR